MKTRFGFCLILAGLPLLLYAQEMAAPTDGSIVSFSGGSSKLRQNIPGQSSVNESAGTYKGELTIPDSTHYQEIETRDGASWVGRITAIGADTIHFLTEYGPIRIPVHNLSTIETMPVSSIREGQYWFKNPNTTRLFFSPTARTLKQGEGYFADYWIFFPSVTFGITDNLTFGGGMSIIPGLDISNQLFFLTPKLGFDVKENVNLATGVLYMNIPEAKALGIIYGVSTFGDENRSATAGLGYGFYGKELTDKPFLMLGGELRTSSHLSVVTENWFGANMEDPIISAGIRFFGRKLSADFALIIFPGIEEGFPALPYLDFVYKFR